MLIGRVGPKRLQRELASASLHEVTYPETNGTRAAQLPAGYNHDRQELVVGHGAAAFIAARQGIRSWAPHRYIGASITPCEAPIALHVTVVVGVPVGPIQVLVPCRIVEVVDEFDRFGFAYGTLPGHPEIGEERFVVTISDTGGVVFRITAFSRPTAPLARLVGPLSHLLQQRATRGYLEGLRAWVADQ